MTFRSRFYLDLCKPRPCIECGAEDGTVVPAHRNRGKGMGLKVSDAWSIPLCLKDHSAYDAGQFDDEWFLNHLADHLDNLLTETALTVTGHNPREKVPVSIPKIIKHDGEYRR